MTVRLGFAIAAHLDPEILVVDEVLAVGDAEFQKKAIGKMQDVAKGEGRTVLFVSHNMGAVKNLCKTGIVLKDGSIVYAGSVNSAVDHYLTEGATNNMEGFYENLKSKETDIKTIQVIDGQCEEKNIFGFDESFSLKFDLSIEKKYVDTLVLGIRVKDQLERSVFVSNIQLNKYIKEAGNHHLLFTIPSSILMPNRYSVSVALHIPNIEFITQLESPVQFTIEETGSDFFQYPGADNGCVSVNCAWEMV
jgi:lipopolysaccharide transport system ATP-binding protein